MTGAQRTALKELAKALFPLAGPDWFQARPGRPFQPEQPLNWRPPAGPLSLSIDDIKVVEFLEDLLANDAGDLALAARWRGLDESTLLAFQDSLPGRRSWRATRTTDDGAPSLDAEHPVFGAVSSANFVIAENGKPLSRGELYDECLPAYMTAVPSGSPIPLADLLADKVAAWPTGIPKASEFVRQFARDVLYATLNFQSTAAARYPEAMAIELGEGRRPGNAFSPLDAQKAVATLKAKIATAPKA